MSAAYHTFKKDFNSLLSAAADYNAAITDQSNQGAEYFGTGKYAGQGLSNPLLNLTSGSTWQQVGHAYELILMLLATGGTQMLSGNLAVKGEALKIQGDITACGNDLQNITQSTSTNGADLGYEAHGLDKMLEVLGVPANFPPVSRIQKMIPYVREALGSLGGSSNATHPNTTIASSLSGEFQIIRNEFYVGGVANFNPAGSPSAAPTSGPRSYYFSNGAPTGDNRGYLESFGEMQTDMGTQGDPKSANEASKTMVNAFNTNTSTTQSANAAANELITQISNTIKTVTSFITDMAHSQQDTSKAAITNMSR